MSQTLKFRICGWGVLFGSIALLILTGTTNWFQGDHQGVTVAGKLINSIGSVSIDVMGLLFCGLATGVCIGTRRWGWAFVFGLALVLSAGWSANSVYSFQATEAISASKTRATANSRIAEADKLARDSVSKMTTFAGKARTTSAREDFIYGSQEAIKSFRDAEVKVIIAPDAGAETLAAKLGWSVETVQQLRSAYFAILIIFLKMIGFPGAGFLLSWSPEPTDRKLAGSSEGSGGKVKSSGETVPKQDENVIPLRAQAEHFQAVSSSNSCPVVLQPESVGQPLPTVRRVLSDAPRPSLKLSLDDLPGYLASLKAGTAIPKQKQLAAMFGTSEATISRRMSDREGRGEVKREKVGRAVKTTILPRRDRGGLHAGV